MVRDEENARAIAYATCVEDAVALARSTAESYAARGAGAVPEPQVVEAAMRVWLDPQTIGHFNRSLVEQLLAADHLAMWEILAKEYPWGPPLLWLAQRVLCLPASEAHAERIVGQVRRTLGDYASRMRDETLLNRVQMAMMHV